MKKADTVAIKPIVYVVDDDVLVRRAIKRLIRSAGLEAESFASAEEFLDCGFRDEQTCLIADVKMPKLTGLDLQKKLIARGHNLPVIFITGFDAEEIREKVKKAGAVGYFSKPIDDRALLDTIKWSLSR
jgi:FixJ family two-component response regulator